MVIKGVDRERWVTIRENWYSSESGCGHGTRDCWCVRAHENPRSDLLQMRECSKRQSTNQENPELLTDFACLFGCTKRLCQYMTACLWTTLRAFVDGQTCYGQLSEILCTPLMCFQRLSELTGNRDVKAQSFGACSGSWIRKW